MIWLDQFVVDPGGLDPNDPELSTQLSVLSGMKSLPPRGRSCELEGWSEFGFKREKFAG